MDQEKIYEYYCSNDMRNLKKMCDKLMSKIGGIDGCDRDDYYSFANWELYKAVESYDFEKCNSFHNYFKLRLENRFKDHLRNCHRDIRCQKIKEKNGDEEEIIYLKPVSLDTPVGDSESVLMDLIPQFIHSEDDFPSDLVLEYIDSLTEKQRRMLIFMLKGVKKQDIREKLELRVSKFNWLLEDMTSFEKTHDLRNFWHIHVYRR